MRNVCADISGNTFSNDIILSNTGSGTADVEQYGAQHGGPLTVVNEFNGNSVMPNGTVTSQMDGFCQIP